LRCSRATGTSSRFSQRIVEGLEEVRNLAPAAGPVWLEVDPADSGIRRYRFMATSAALTQPSFFDVCRVLINRLG